MFLRFNLRKDNIPFLFFLGLFFQLRFGTIPFPGQVTFKLHSIVELILLADGSCTFFRCFTINLKRWWLIEYRYFNLPLMFPIKNGAFHLGSSRDPYFYTADFTSKGLNAPFTRKIFRCFRFDFGTRTFGTWRPVMPKRPSFRQKSAPP